MRRANQTPDQKQQSGLINHSNYKSVITQQNRPNVIQNPVHRPVPLKIPISAPSNLPAFASVQPPSIFSQHNLSSFAMPQAFNELQNTIASKNNEVEILNFNEFSNNQQQQNDSVVVAAAAASHFTHFNALLNDYWKCIGLQALITNPTHIQPTQNVVSSSNNLTTISSQATQSISNINTNSNSGSGGIWMPQHSMPQIGTTPRGILSNKYNNNSLNTANCKIIENEAHQKLLNSSVANLSSFSSNGGRAAAEQPMLPSFGATAAASIQPLIQNSSLTFETYSASSAAANSTTAALINLHAASECQSLLQSSVNTTITAATAAAVNAAASVASNIAATPNSTATLLQFQENVKQNKFKNNLKIEKTSALNEKKNVLASVASKSTKIETLDTYQSNFQIFNAQLANAETNVNSNNDYFDITSKVNFILNLQY